MRAGSLIQFALLVAAIGHVAHYQIRNRGTIAGSVAHADPSGDWGTVLLALDADAPSTSVNYYGTEVEPYLAVDPSNPNIQIGGWHRNN